MTIKILSNAAMIYYQSNLSQSEIGPGKEDLVLRLVSHGCSIYHENYGQ